MGPWNKTFDFFLKFLSEVSKVNTRFQKLPEGPKMNRKSLNYFPTFSPSALNFGSKSGIKWKTQSFYSERRFFDILQPTHFISKIIFWAKVFSDLKSVGWIKLTVEYLKLSYFKVLNDRRNDRFFATNFQARRFKG